MAYWTERSKRPGEISANPLWGESASRTRAASISPQRRHLDLEFHLRLDQRAHEASCCRPDISEYFSQHWPDGIPVDHVGDIIGRSEEHTSELQSLMRISYAVFCLKKKKHTNKE